MPETASSDDEHYLRGRPSKRKRELRAKKPLPSPEPSDESFTHDHDHDHDPDAHTREDTCKAIQQAYQAVWENFCGKPASRNPVFCLQTQEAYKSLHNQLAECHGLLEHFEGLRKDWDSGVLTLFLMSPTPLHEEVQMKVVDVITKELDRVTTQNPSLGPFRSKISSGGQRRIRVKPANSRSRVAEWEKCPDGSFRYEDALYPPFVLEVAYSQEEKDLLSKVDTYFERIPGAISAVLTIDIDYAEENDRSKPDFFHTAAVSLWSSEARDDTLVIKHTKARVFRGDDGQAKTGQIKVPFSLFLPIEERSRLPPDINPDICLTFARLAEIVGFAERQQRMEDAGDTFVPAFQVLKRVRVEDADGTVLEERPIRRVKRPRGSSQQSSLSVRTRSMSQPRRSGRLRSVSSVRDVRDQTIR